MPTNFANSIIQMHEQCCPAPEPVEGCESEVQIVHPARRGDVLRIAIDYPVPTLGLKIGLCQGCTVVREIGEIIRDPPLPECVADLPISSDSDANALFAAMTVQPNTLRKKIILSTIHSLKLAGIWNKLDALWIPAAHDRQAARLNWRNPALFELTEKNWGVVNYHNVDVGFLDTVAPPDPSNPACYDTNFNTATDGTNYTLNQASLWIFDDGSIQKTAHGANTSDPLFGYGTVKFAYGTEVNSYLIAHTVTNFNMTVREAINSVKIYQEGALAFTSGSVSAALLNDTLHMTVVKVGAIITTYGITQRSLFGCAVGGSLTATEAQAFYEIMRCYYESINPTFFSPLF